MLILSSKNAGLAESMVILALPNFWGLFFNLPFCFRFIVKKGAPGLKATKMEKKIGLRMVQNGDILLNKVFVPDEDKLPGVNSFQDTNKVLYSRCVLLFLRLMLILDC